MICIKLQSVLNCTTNTKPLKKSHFLGFEKPKNLFFKPILAGWTLMYV